MPKNIRATARHEPAPAQRRGQQKVEPRDAGRRFVTSEPLRADAERDIVEIPALPRVSAETLGLLDLDEPDPPPHGSLAAGEPLRAETPVARAEGLDPRGPRWSNRVRPDGRATSTHTLKARPSWRGSVLLGGAILAVAVVIGVALGVTGSPDDSSGPNEAAETETESGADTETGAQRETVAGTESGAQTEAEAEAEAGTNTRTDTETGAETDTMPGLGGDTAPPPPTDLAALPQPSAEALRENPWVRRNRAARLREEARRLYVNGRFREASRGFLHSLEWQPDSVDAMRHLSRALQRLDDMDTALAWARRCVAVEPENPRNHELLGDQLLMLDRNEEAIETYRAGVAASPSDIRLRSRIRRLQ